MKTSTILIIGLVILTVIFLGFKLNNKILESKNNFFYYDSETKYSDTRNIEKINISNYSCKEIDYAISNNLNLISGEYPIAYYKTRRYEKTWDRSFINETTISTRYVDGYTHYSKEELGKYYLMECLK